MDKKLPEGKGLYVWSIVDMPVAFYVKFYDMGISWIAVKIANGISSSNRRCAASGAMVDDILMPFVQSARQFGMRVLGWQYVYMFNPDVEAERAAERVEKFGLDGFIIDAEHQCYGKHTQAKQYSKMLRQLMPDTPIGLSTYRFPTLHSTLPYKKFLDVCDFNSPQVYWNTGKARQELEASYDQYEIIKPLPFIPAGRSYYGEGFSKPTPAETHEFLTTAQELGCPAALFWSADALWHRLKSLPEIRAAIKKYEWTGIGDPDLPDEPLPNHMLLDKLRIITRDDNVYENAEPIHLKLKE